MNKLEVWILIGTILVTLAVAGDVIFDTNEMTVEQDLVVEGNLGVGTTSPEEKLEVNGNIYIQDNNKSLYGTGKNASIYYNGTDLKINPAEVGSGKVYVSGNLTATGTITGSNLSGTNTGDQESGDFDIKDLTDSTSLRASWTAKMDEVVNDTSPQLGGTLDSQENSIDNVGDVIHDNDILSDWNLVNQDKDKDTLVKINDDGTEKTAIQVHGDSGVVSFPHQSAIKAEDSSKQVITNGTWTKLTLTEVHDGANEFNNSTDTWTAKHDGIYLITLSTTWNLVTQYKTFQLRILKNGATTLRKVDDWQVADKWAVPHNVITVAVMSAGDTIIAEAFHNSGIDRELRNKQLTITKVA